MQQINKYEADMNTTDIFKRYDSPEQYAEAFQQMIDARERWREQMAHPDFPWHTPLTATATHSTDNACMNG